jgi:hypothetical protein
MPNIRGAVIDARPHRQSRGRPLLISLLGSHVKVKDEDAQNAVISATVALGQLTHVYAEQGPGGSSIPGWHSRRWQNRWLTSGPTSIYKPGHKASLALGVDGPRSLWPTACTRFEPRLTSSSAAIGYVPTPRLFRVYPTDLPSGGVSWREA